MDRCGKRYLQLSAKLKPKWAKNYPVSDSCWAYCVLKACRMPCQSSGVTQKIKPTSSSHWSISRSSNIMISLACRNINGICTPKSQKLSSPAGGLQSKLIYQAVKGCIGLNDSAGPPESWEPLHNFGNLLTGIYSVICHCAEATTYKPTFALLIASCRWRAWCYAILCRMLWYGYG